MLVTFVSQCQKTALKKTRKVLDAFANRIGDNVWQTAITEDGLRAVRTALTKTASRSTAVSCHRLKSRNQTQLLWIVGNKRQFNELGFVAVNTTKRNILHSEWENHWQFLQALQAVSTLAGLLHDIGKSSNGFQQKLQNKNGPSKIGDPYRHEWLSLKLLYWLLKDCQTDAQVWHRLQTIDEFLLTHTPTLDDIKTHINQAQLHKLPIVTQWLAWLIVTHHRVPPLQAYYFSPQAKKPLLRTNHRFFAIPIDAYYQQMVNAIDGWVKNSKSLDAMNDKQKTAFFCFDNLVWHSPTWQKSLKRYAKKAAEDALLTQLSQQQTAIANPVLLMLSRLSLMIGDHNYSALKQQDKAQRVQGDKAWQDKLIANTDGEEPNQALDEHLLGVGQYTAKFCRNLPLLHQGLPKLTNHEPLAKNTQNPKFLWQNKAFALAKSDSDTAQTHGFFGVNMASTGAGKTIGNARIMYALGNQNGVRLTIALGLRTLTLQTGQSFRQNLQLASDKLAVLVGGQAHQQLHATNEQNSEQNDTLTKLGSESAEQLIDEWVDADDSTRLDDLHLGTIIKDNKARKLIGSPLSLIHI